MCIRDRGDGGTGRVAWGLDYLFGLVEQGDTFRAFWAHHHAEERRALIDFLEYVRERRERHPGLHIYHYAPYERTHLLTRAARHGGGEGEQVGALVGRVVVDVQARMPLPSLAHVLEEVDQRPAFLGVGVRPERAERAILLDQAEQVVEPPGDSARA